MSDMLNKVLYEVAVDHLVDTKTRMAVYFLLDEFEKYIQQKNLSEQQVETLIYLIEDGQLWLRKEQNSTITLSININDIFGPCSDSYEITSTDELKNFLDCVSSGDCFIAPWVSLRIGHEPWRNRTNWDKLVSTIIEKGYGIQTPSLNHSKID